MRVSENNGTPKWMVKIMENPYEQMNDFGGYHTHYFRKHPYIFWILLKCEGNKHLGVSAMGPRVKTSRT